MESLALAFSSGWASGINAYLVVLVLGIADRVGDYPDIPNVLARWDVLAIAGFLFAMEFVADKIPYLDSTWDAISTLIRPTAGAVIGALLAGTVAEDASLDVIVLSAVGGGTALLSHLSKAGLRLAINTSPEPATNIGVSLLEDFSVLVIIAFAVEHPRLAAAIAAVLLVAGLVLLFLAAKLVRRGWRRWKSRGRSTDRPTGTVP
ncbi:MAG TPA: DUF4126 domain-containing protein [Nocardioides sp.]|uniref:DUF4126 domain-containing protein n=1 Tax=uncultured Nocardioides sp. TaxID=198441 RepID=UPI000EBB00B3|nr:DUF4126 domain-containing protein [uncultured Nocardioides sp.]HCB05968.1 DUF4126 domain-containing protein [Nocardioides sp.]HRD62533.1 DUF4126 domain-containing protein [Nocardioides sp.]HRI98627.1 DUF4126 domain-containing protein [Nocardioides sp.]HRK48339.1 DUF4126 domain-containing protein [Nocardioides sp.]